MIRNANSAVERVRNQLSYKLGQAMIASSKAAVGGGGILSLIISLYKIKKSHTKNHKIYQQTI